MSWRPRLHFDLYWKWNQTVTEINTAERGLSGGWDVKRSGTIRACVLDIYNTDG